MNIANTKLYIGLTCYTGIIFFWLRYFIKNEIKKRIKGIANMSDNVAVIKEAINYINDRDRVKNLMSKNDGKREPDDAA